MSAVRELRGGCHCGRNSYIITMPQDRVQEAQVIFNTDPSHQMPLGTPLAAYIRVPITWYRSTTATESDGEKESSIHRAYTHPDHPHSKRKFCAVCGTPLSYWSESPLSEGAFISLTLGSLRRRDIRDLEDLGLIPGMDDDADKVIQATEVTEGTALRHSFGVPWFDNMVEGTRLGKLRRSQGVQASQNGRVLVEWDIEEYVDGDKDDSNTSASMTTPGKRKLQDLDKS